MPTLPVPESKQADVETARVGAADAHLVVSRIGRRQPLVPILMPTSPVPELNKPVLPVPELNKPVLAVPELKKPVLLALEFRSWADKPSPVSPDADVVVAGAERRCCCCRCWHAG